MKPKKKKDKLKLKPTLKEKRHYMIIAVSSNEKLNDNDIKNKIESAIKHFIGSLGLASAGPIFVKILDKSKKNISISVKSVSGDSVRATTQTSKDKQHTPYTYRYLILLSVLTKYVDYVKAALLLWKENSTPIKCVGVSGTIKKSERFLN